jgi:hypothetical protein
MTSANACAVLRGDAESPIDIEPAMPLVVALDPMATPLDTSATQLTPTHVAKLPVAVACLPMAVPPIPVVLHVASNPKAEQEAVFAIVKPPTATANCP